MLSASFAVPEHMSWCTVLYWYRCLMSRAYGTECGSRRTMSRGVPGTVAKERAHASYREESSGSVFYTPHFAGTLTWLLSQARPSKMPSPVVAQLGSTFQMWFLAMTFRLRASETSLGRMAGVRERC